MHVSIYLDVTTSKLTNLPPAAKTHAQNTEIKLTSPCGGNNTLQQNGAHYN